MLKKLKTLIKRNPNVRTAKVKCLAGHKIRVRSETSSDVETARLTVTTSAKTDCPSCRQVLDELRRDLSDFYEVAQC